MLASMDRLSSPLLTLFASLGGSAADVVARPDWQAHFDARRARGTFVLYEPALDRYSVFDEGRAKQRFLPAATFEIANAVIALELGAITDEAEVFRWDGRPKPVAAWERDHTLASGMQASATWMFQEIARRIGKARMREWIDRLDYGNRDLSGGIDLFWLQGGLRISAMEQVKFLHRLAEGRLPATQRAQRLVRNAMVAGKTRSHALYARAGAADSGRNAVAWWAGWVERMGRPVAYFALNLEPSSKSVFADRFVIGRSILTEAGHLPSS